MLMLIVNLYSAYSISIIKWSVHEGNEAWPQHRELHALLFTNSVWVLFTSHRVMNIQGLWDGAFGPYPRRLERLECLNHLLMQLQTHHFLLSYFKTLDVDPAGVELTTSSVTARCSTNWATGEQWFVKGPGYFLMRCLWMNFLIRTKIFFSSGTANYFS